MIADCHLWVHQDLCRETETRRRQFKTCVFEVMDSWGTAVVTLGISITVQGLFRHLIDQLFQRITWSILLPILKSLRSCKITIMTSYKELNHVSQGKRRTCPFLKEVTMLALFLC
jgi:hypothetical protein